MSKEQNYYERELDKIDFTGEHSAHVLFGSDGVSTKALAVNAECAAAIIAKLFELFVFPAAAPIPAPLKTIERAHHVNYTTGRNKNGNKILKVKAATGKGFCVQTCGNLPETDRNGVSSATDAEACDYVTKYGTPRQKRILGI